MKDYLALGHWYDFSHDEDKQIIEIKFQIKNSRFHFQACSVDLYGNLIRLKHCGTPFKFMHTIPSPISTVACADSFTATTNRAAPTTMQP
jgi:hypothetical protein